MKWILRLGVWMVVSKGHPTLFTRTLSKHPWGKRVLILMLRFYFLHSRKELKKIIRIKPCVTMTKRLNAQRKN